LFTLFGIDPYLSLIIVVPLSLLLGTAFYQGLFKEAAALEDKNISLLIAIGLMFFVENLMTVIWTGNPRSIQTIYTSLYSGPWDSIYFTRLVALLIAVLSTVGVVLFLKRLIGMAWEPLQRIWNLHLVGNLSIGQCRSRDRHQTCRNRGSTWQQLS
jgi:branched-chain amino acid transport system permease protein